MRHITLLLTILVTLFTGHINAQTISGEYLIGKWKSTDSSTGIKHTAQFEINDTLTFHGVDDNKWRYSVEIKDSIIYLKSNVEYPKITFHNEGILVIQNNNCFWWFNPIEYYKYITALQKGYNITHKSEFEDWFKKIRSVYYRL